MEIEVRRVGIEDAAAIRALRLRALETDPVAFGESDAVKNAPDQFWVEWTNRHATGADHASFIALLRGRLVAMVRAARSHDEPRTFSIHSLWTDPKHRRQGLADLLLAAVESWIRQNGGQIVNLFVVESSHGARALYWHAGYRVNGEFDASPFEGVVEIGMSKHLVETH